jgi:hypothetical protein
MVYRYLFKRKISAEANSPEAAERAAEKKLVHALEQEVDMQPCPGCGLYQPDMIASQRASRHWLTFWAGTPVYALILILVLTDVFSMTTGAVLAGVFAILFLAIHFFVDLNNPNSNLDANRRLGMRRAKDGDIWVAREDTAETRTSRPISNGLFAGHWICYAMLAAAVLAFFLPMVARLLLGMKGNAGLYPEVVGPGDTPYIYFNERTSSVKKLWSGQPRVTVLNAAEVGVPVTVGATSNNDNWGNSISVKSSEKNSSFTPWARLQFPADANLAGKKLDLRVDMTLTYPSLAGGNSWQPQTKALSHTMTVHLSSARAGGTFKGSFWLGFVGGMGLLFLAGGLLPIFSNQFRQKAHPTRIFVPGGGQDEGTEEDDRPREAIRAEEDENRQRQIKRGDDEAEDRPRRVRREDDEDEDRPRRRRRDDY